ncbi:MAG TPA: S8 family serine peptidase [Gaiellaceae bacterium]|nr:S8 family serine peptidase [Gaiellaceae bacterium]
MRVYQFRHIRADGQCSGAPIGVFTVRRGLLVVLAAALALSLAGASAGRTSSSTSARVELVALLDGKPLAERPHARAAIEREQADVVRRIREAVPSARIRWRYQLVLNGLAVVAPADSAKLIEAIPDVKTVQAGVTYHRSLYESPQVIGAPQVWGPTLATAGEGMKIAIIDDGVDQKHPYFSPAGFTMPAGFPKGNKAYTTAKVIVARTFPPPGANWKYAHVPFDPVESEHGTHVAGIAAGDYDTTADGGNGPVKVSGIAPRAYIGNYRIGTIPTPGMGLDGNSAEIAAAIEQAVKDGMNVINLSYGEPEITPSRDIVVQAMNAAADAGVVPVIAAGNDFDAVGPGSMGSPATAAKAIAVAAASTTGLIAYFSSGGPSPVSLALKPDVTAPGVGILSSVPAHDGSWQFLDGTSMAAPHVAGAAAVLLQRHPDWTVAQVKSALVSTGNAVHGGSGHEVSPTREGGGMIWLPRADQPLVFAQPSDFSFGLLHRPRGGIDLYFLGSNATDAGGGAGAWHATVSPTNSVRGARVSVNPTLNVPGKLTLGVRVSPTAGPGDGSGFVVLTRGSDTRRFPYWFRVTVPRLGSERSTLLRRPGVYHGDTRGRPSRVSSYRYPAAPRSLGVAARLAGPEQVFRFVVRGRIANAGAVVTSQSAGVHVSPRLVRAGNEDMLAGYTGLPLRLNPYLPGYFGIVPAVGVFRPAPGTYDLVFDTRSRRATGRFTFRFWLNDTTPPSVGLLTRSIGRGGSLLLRVRDRGSGVDPSTMTGSVDGRARHLVWDQAHGLVQVRLPALPRGRHKLALTVSDYQESKNNENGATVLPNTRHFAAVFTVR